MRGKLPTNLKKVALFLERLPGIGKKTASRLAFYFLRLPEADLKEFGESIIQLKKKTNFCQICLNVTESEQCYICQDNTRNRRQITVVETVLDLLSFETGDIYNGLYHVLHGRIDPLNNIRPEDIYIDHLLKRIETNGKDIEEVIIATNPDMEGEATALYLRRRLKSLQKENGLSFTITRLAYGLPIGANLEYADYMTLRKAFEGRKHY